VPPEIISAIDVGTTKICALMAQVEPDSLGNVSLNILGEGHVASRGIRRGVVVNVADATAAIGEAVEKCEREAGRHMLSAYVGIAGSHIATLNSTGVSPVDRRQGVTPADMQRALEGARAVALPQNQEVIHTIARQWTVDGQSEIQHPLGMTAYRLEVDAHIVTGSSTAISNLVQCVTKHDIDIDALVLEPLASNAAVLKPDERRMGVAVVDMGGGTTDIALFRDDGLCNTQVLDMGGNHLSQDVAVALSTPYESAEALKVRYGNVIPDRVAADESVWAQVFGERSERNFSRRFICTVLEARATEMFEIIRDRLEQTGNLSKLPAGVVITGGSSQLPGLVELGRSILQMPVRVGSPQPSLPITGLSRGLLSPTYATSVGLLLWGLRRDDSQMPKRYTSNEPPPGATAPATGALWSKAREMLRYLLPG
jgi:cell division protein FtsA